MKTLTAPLSHYAITIAGIVTVAKTRARSPEGEIIPQRVWRGKLRVKLTDDNGKPRQCWLHELVWNTYAAEPLASREKIVFLDGNSLNPHFDNLAVIRRGDTRPVIHPDNYLIPAPAQALAIGTKKSDWRGSANPNAKLSERQAAAIRYGNKRMTQADMAEHLGVSQATISHVITGKTWAHVWKSLV